jgi:hypothetical protein
MLRNNIDNNKRAEKSTTRLNTAPILKVRASGDACQVAICGRAIKFDCSDRSLVSSTQQSNSNDVGDGNSNKVGGNKEGNGKGGNGNGSSNKDDGQAMATTWAIVTATRVAGNEEGDGKDGKGGGNNNKLGHGNGNNMGNGDGNDGGGQQKGRWQGKRQGWQGQW